LEMAVGVGLGDGLGVGLANATNVKDVCASTWPLESRRLAVWTPGRSNHQAADEELCGAGGVSGGRHRGGWLRHCPGGLHGDHVGRRLRRRHRGPGHSDKSRLSSRPRSAPCRNPGHSDQPILFTDTGRPEVRMGRSHKEKGPSLRGRPRGSIDTSGYLRRAARERDAGDNSNVKEAQDVRSQTTGRPIPL
jgi:hypothetical protein